MRGAVSQRRAFQRSIFDPLAVGIRAQVVVALRGVGQTMTGEKCGSDITAGG